MTTEKAVLVATLGTRDLMYQATSGVWYNVGDDRMRDGEIIGEQAEVISDLGLPFDPYYQYRSLTEYLLQNLDRYRDRLKPVIIGKLLRDKATEIGAVYLVVTDQKPEVSQREKDTLHAGEIIKDWIRYLNSDIQVHLIALGNNGENPSNFEEMFAWWRKIWRERIIVKSEQPLWVCLKGGVGQTSEASRVSGLSFHGDRIFFYEFQQNAKANRAGLPSEYSDPEPGINYLWDRTQQEAIALLEGYNYGETLSLLKEYIQKDTSGFGETCKLLKAGIAWNQGSFETFFNLSKNSFSPEDKRRNAHWSWKAYEQAYTGVVRLQQQNTVEAMLHSFRAVEGSLWLWAIREFDFIEEKEGTYPLLHESVFNRFPKLKNEIDFKEKKQVSLNLYWIRLLWEAENPALAFSQDFKEFWDIARPLRNQLSHRLGGISEDELWKAWGVKNEHEWQRRILHCLNAISGKKFKSLMQASLFTDVHAKVLNRISIYQP